MEHLLNERVRSIQISGIRKFFNLVSQHEGAVSLTIGLPDFHTPDHIKAAAKQAIDDNNRTYTPNAGIPELRQAAADFLSNKYSLDYKPDTEVITTIGASEAIDVALRTLLSEGSEVILPVPVYPGYEPVIRMCGALPVYVDTRDSGFKISAAQIREKLTDKTRCIVLPYPSNPTGVTLDRTALAEIAELLKDRDVFILSDEIYSELIYEGQHQSIAQFQDMWNKTVVINGLSKSHAMTGWRIGFIFAPEYIAKHMIKVHQYAATCASSISQYAALEALTAGVDDALPMRKEYAGRRDYVHGRLIAMGLEVIKPEGAFYMFVAIGQFGKSSFDFALDLLENAKVAVVPGDAFSSYGEGYVRISYAYAMDQLKEALDRMEAYLNQK